MVYKPFDENSAATCADKCTTYTETGINSYSGSEKQQLAACLPVELYKPITRKFKLGRWY